MTGPTTSRRTIVKGAAWSAPVLTAAAVAPSLAASPADAPNLSTSTSGGTPTRTNSSGNAQLTLAPSTFINSGGVNAEGLTVVFTSNTPIDGIELLLFGSPIPPEGLGITFSEFGSTTVTMNVPAGTQLGQVSIPPEGSYTSPASQRLTFNGDAATDPITLNVTVTAANGGVPWTSPDVVCSTTACTTS